MKFDGISLDFIILKDLLSKSFRIEKFHENPLNSIILKGLLSDSLRIHLVNPSGL